MIVNSQHFDNIADLALRIEAGDNFAADLQMFSQQVEAVTADLYRYCRDESVLTQLDRLPRIETQAHQPSFLEKMLPVSSRSMYGNYKNRELVRDQVRKIAQGMDYIRRLLDDELV